MKEVLPKDSSMEKVYHFGLLKIEGGSKTTTEMKGKLFSFIHLTF